MKPSFEAGDQVECISPKPPWLVCGVPYTVLDIILSDISGEDRYYARIAEVSNGDNDFRIDRFKLLASDNVP